jgi:hypothetical protein
MESPIEGTFAVWASRRTAVGDTKARRATTALAAVASSGVARGSNDLPIQLHMLASSVSH